LTRIQNELFILGSYLATTFDVKTKSPKITKIYITRLEKEIDNWDKDLPKLKNFILPGGSKVGANFHLARTICRRSERSIAALAKQENINENILSYINRLSDWFFMLARFVNKLYNVHEIEWKVRS
jgi:cob(I)alamin adenosyltransferase